MVGIEPDRLTAGVLGLLWFALGDVPVLAVQAAKAAPGGGEREHVRAGQEMEQRFLFDGVNGYR